MKFGPHRWFAWFPVLAYCGPHVLEYEWVWLRVIGRQRCKFNCCWVYWAPRSAC